MSVDVTQATPGWVATRDRMPAMAEAMVFHRDGANGAWIGAVRGRFHGREMPCLVVNFGDGTRVAPMVHGGLALHDDVTEWAPWPSPDFPLPSSAA